MLEEKENHIMLVMLGIQSSSPEEKSNHEIPKFLFKLCLHKKLASMLSTSPSAQPIKVDYIVLLAPYWTLKILTTIQCHTSYSWSIGG